MKSEEDKETPSLFRKKKAFSQQEAEDKRISEQREPFTQEDLNHAWKEFKVKYMAEGAGNVEKLVLRRKLEKINEQSVRILLNSQLEVTLLEKFEKDLIHYFRIHLKNQFIQLVKSVPEQEEIRKLYTSKDKFDYMVSQNPALKLLKDKFELDFEY